MHAFNHDHPDEIERRALLAEFYAVPQMPEIEHLDTSVAVTGNNFYARGLRDEFGCDALDAPWLLPMGGVSAVAEPGVADCFVEREDA